LNGCCWSVPEQHATRLMQLKSVVVEDLAEFPSDLLAFSNSPCKFVEASAVRFSKWEVHSAIKSLPIQSPGPDGILMDQLLPHVHDVTELINLCWERGSLPRDVGKSYLISIPKSSTDERGITIVRSLEKVLMKLLLWRHAH